jgi:hypothetical protein
MIRWIATGRTKLSILYFVDKNSPPWKRVSAGQSLEAIEVNQQIRNDAPKTERLSAGRSLIRFVQVDTDRQFCRRCGAPSVPGYPTTAFFECPTPFMLTVACCTASVRNPDLFCSAGR